MTIPNAAAIRQNPVLRWFLQARRIPLLFAVTIVSGIFYHYSPSFTVVWILLSVGLQAALFKLFDFVKAHPFLGGIAYAAVGFLFLMLAGSMVRVGYDGAIFAPDDPKLRLSFFVWFLTPQSVLETSYVGYTIALFLLFTFFIASITYYFTLVRYRVLMSFMVMIFPFAIYAKENETMPVPSIIILLLCYFAVMIYCRQAHAESPEVTQRYQPNAAIRLKMPHRKSAYAGVRPELLDGGFLRAAGIFLSAATILILVIPKPTVTADRQYLDTMLDMSALSNYLMNAISGFADSSDGGTYSAQSYSRALYYFSADEPLNLRVRTFTNYSYDTDSWNVSAYDERPARTDYRFVQQNGLMTVSADQNPAELLAVVQYAAQQDPAFAEKWHLTEFAGMDINADAYVMQLDAEAASFNSYLYPAPLQTITLNTDVERLNHIYQNESGILYRYIIDNSYRESYHASYLSPQFANSAAARTLTAVSSTQTWAEFLLDLQNSIPNTEQEYQDAAQAAVNNYLGAQSYAQSVTSETPERVRQLAQEITAGLTTDYDKAVALRDYLRDGDFLYSLEFQITDDDNVETFLFENKTGVCYQFASAMAEMCRSVGLITRYVEGYSMSEKYDGLNTKWDYVVTTDHGHAFVEVFIAGYGWMMFDATAASLLTTENTRGNVIITLQYSGLILFGTAVLLTAVMIWLVPFCSEKLFRRRYRKQRNAAAVQAAFARLRKQWKADPAVTARVLCAEQSAFLGCDLQILLDGFEQTVYAGRCTPETADAVFAVYCTAYDAWKPACKRARQEARQAKKQAKAAAHTA